MSVAAHLLFQLFMGKGVLGHLLDLSLAIFGVLSVGFADVGSFSHSVGFYRLCPERGR